MTFTWLKSALLSLSVLVSPADLPSGEAPPPRAMPVGQLLVASPEIGDPRFYHAVILMVQHDGRGAFGIILNRPAGDHPLADLLKATGQDSTGATGSVRLFAGGPVQPELGFIVHTAEYRRGDTIGIDSRVAMTANPQVLVDIGHHQGPAKSLVAFGYTGWGPGQLEAEMARGGWFLEPEDPKLVFDDDRDRLWDDAMARRTVPL